MIFFRVLGRLLSGFFGRLGRFTIGIFRFIGRHETVLGAVVVLGVLVGGIWLLLTALNINIVVGEPKPVVQAAGTNQANAANSTAKVVTNNAPQVTEAFMRGQIYFNADDVWNSLDPELHNELAQIGRDKDFYARRFTQLKESGVRYQEYRYIGGYDSGRGETIHFYVARYTDTDKQVKDTAYTLVVSPQGKIIAFS